ncbi:hypothetical protein EDB84DRAFT_1443510 [Lactarius hengduanensis]|nr:hypothetical protein EDB84DRAFT_1443510 [Lactarius hengduanensis]
MTTKVLNYMPDRLAEDTESSIGMSKSDHYVTGMQIPENTNPSLIHVSTGSPQVDNANMDLTSKLGTPFARSEKPGKRPGTEFDTQIDRTNALLDVVNALSEGSTPSQFHVSHNTAIPIQQPKPELTHGDLYALCQEVQSALRRIIELEKGIVGSDRSLRRERIQIGLDIAVADNWVRARGLPFLIIILAIITTMVLNAYKGQRVDAKGQAISSHERAEPKEPRSRHARESWTRRRTSEEAENLGGKGERQQVGYLQLRPGPKGGLIIQKHAKRKRGKSTSIESRSKAFIYKRSVPKIEHDPKTLRSRSKSRESVNRGVWPNDSAEDDDDALMVQENVSKSQVKSKEYGPAYA